MSKPSRRYIAIWYDLAKAEVGARQRGWNEDREPTLHDYLDIEEALSRSQPFPTSHDARLHLQRVISDDDLGAVEVQERVERPCRDCHCDGWLPVFRHSIFSKTKRLYSYNPDALGCDEHGPIISTG
jgi:hypothetical protein